MSSRTPLRAYSGPGALLVGVMQIVVGLVMMCLQVPFSMEDLLPAKKAVGIWAGLIFTFSGILCVVSSRIRTKPVVTSMFAVAIIVWFLCVAAGIVAYILMLLGTIHSITRYKNEEYQKYKLTEVVSYSQVGMCVIQGMLEIAAMVLCGRALCACCGTSSQEPVVVYVKRPDEREDLLED